jgi:hypothetical protein
MGGDYVGMFDWYEPIPPLSCPVCGTQLNEWQGKDGPNALFVWKQGHISPTDQLASEDAKLEPAKMARWKLPNEFVIYSYDCTNHAPIMAHCETKDGVWSTTRVEDFGGKKGKAREPKGGV